jgi:hypothetical protein
MPVRKRATAKRPALRPERLRREANRLRGSALKAINAGTRQDFEDMAEARETVARAIEELEAEKADADKAEDDKPDQKP